MVVSAAHGLTSGDKRDERGVHEPDPAGGILGLIAIATGSAE